MIVKIIQQVLRFFFLVAVQVIVLNHIQWSGYVNPYIYILFILMLPVETPNWMLLLLSLIIGLTIDMFGNSGGIHAASTVLIGFARPGILKLIAPRDGYESETRLTPQVMGFNWFATYVTMMVLIHHFAYFYLEVFRFSEFFMTFLKVLINSAITIGLILLSQYLFGKQMKRNERIIG